MDCVVYNPFFFRCFRGISTLPLLIRHLLFPPVVSTILITAPSQGKAPKTGRMVVSSMEPSECNNDEALLERFLRDPLSVVDESFYHHEGNMEQADLHLIRCAKELFASPQALSRIPFLTQETWKKDGSLPNNGLVRFRGMVQVRRRRRRNGIKGLRPTDIPIG